MTSYDDPVSVDSARAGIHKVVSTGFRNRCPFCTARLQSGLAEGEKIVLLKGYNANRIATCIKIDKKDININTILFDDAPESGFFRISNCDSYIKMPLPKLPSWILPLSVDDNNVVEGASVQLIKSVVDSDGKWRQGTSFRLAEIVWRRRLPISADEVLGVLLAHGLPGPVAPVFQLEFETAIGALVEIIGKLPNARKRMPPFQAGMYMTPRQRNLYARIQGLTPPAPPSSS